MRIWIDIGSPSQARYLLPIARRFGRAGADVLLTARAYRDTFAILRGEGAAFDGVGAAVADGFRGNLSEFGRRTRALIDFIGNQPKPTDLVLTESRAATLAARRLGIPSFAIVDCEHLNVVFGVSGTHVLHPNVINGHAFIRRGVTRKHLLPFDGLKEDISFADLDISSVAAYTFDDAETSAVRVLFRPPVESRRLAIDLLRHFAEQPARVVFSPRDRRQLRLLDEVSRWEKEPIVLREPVPLISLLKGVDAVVSGGRRMLREAAFLGVPAYSVGGASGAVERYLASTGRLSILASPIDFAPTTSSRELAPLRKGSGIAQHVADLILERAMSKRKKPV